MANIKYLHIIRGFAALFVVLAHAKWPFWIGGSAFLENTSFSHLNIFNKLGLVQALSSSNGTAMVIVFYVLSGFIISYSYQKNKWTYRQFLVNRAARIYIPYLASAVLAGFVLWLAIRLAAPIFTNPVKDYHQRIFVAYTEGLNGWNFIKTLFFIKTERINYFGFNYVYWSLLYEMLFYLFFPFILKFNKAVLVITACIYPLHFIFNPLPEINYWYFYFTEFLFYFSSGVFLFQQLKSKNMEVLKTRVYLKKPLLFFVLAATFFLIILGGVNRFKDLSFFAAGIFGLTWIFFILLHGIKNNLLSKAFLFLGTISYSLYLVHVPLLLFFYSLLYYFFQWHTYPSPWIYLLFVFLTIPFAYIFYLVFERLSFKLIERQKKKLHKKTQEPDFLKINAG